MGSMILLAAHHFLIYTRQVANDLASSIDSVGPGNALNAPVSRSAEATVGG
jgi:hypothetical protein